MTLVTVDHPWAPELLSRPLPPGTTRIEVDAEELALVELGRRVDALAPGGWAAIGRLWRPALQRDLLRLAAEHGARNVGPELIREILPERAPPSRLLPYVRETRGGDGSTAQAVAFLPAEEEERFLALADAAIPGGWCAWTPDERAAFVTLLSIALRSRAPHEIPDAWIPVLVCAVERRSGARLAS